MHDYAERGAELRERYGSPAAVEAMMTSPGPSGRRLRLPGGTDRGQPVMLKEFGGVRFTPGATSADGT